MSLTLILMRHAKSSWESPGLNDHERPLNPRGQKSAAALGDWMRDCGLVPDQCLVSTAVRTQETFARLCLGPSAEPVSALYHASPETMLRVLRQATGKTVLMVGHNPGISIFAQLLIQRWPEHERFGDFPTGATLVARFDSSSWQDVALQTGDVIDFVIPRELLAQ